MHLHAAPLHGHVQDAALLETVIREVMLDKQPTKEFVTTAQIGALAAFLATDAAAQINGAALPVEGGWTAE